VTVNKSALATNEVPLTTFYAATPVQHNIDAENFLALENENAKNVKRTTLPNGLTLVSNDSVNKGSSVVGLYVNAGSRFQTYKNEGVAHFVERFFYAGTNQRSQLRLVTDLQKTGAAVSSQAGREQIVYQSESLREAVPHTLELIANSVLQGRLLDWDMPPKKKLVKLDVDSYGQEPEFVLAELLHQTAFNKKTLGRSLVCPVHQIDSISTANVIDYMNTLFTPKRMTLVATNFNHDDLTVLGERLFGFLEDNNTFAPLPATANETARYVGGSSEVSAVLDGPADARTQSIIAFEGVSAQDVKQYYAVNVLAQLLGSGSNVYVPQLSNGSLLQKNVVSRSKAIRHARAFSISYSDSGLFGVFVQGRDGQTVSDAIFASVDSIKNSAEQITEQQLAAAKNQVLLNFASGLECGRGFNEFNAKFQDQDSHIDTIKKLTLSDVKQAAKKIVQSKPTLVSVGNLDGLISTRDL
jgi:predicted Zn-dependent peptidase